MEGNTTNATIVGEAALLSLDTGSWFVLAATLCVFFGPLFVLFPPFPPRRSDALWQTHTKLGIAKPSKSKLRDHAATTAAAAAAAAAAQAKIKSLFVYPVESCSGIEVARAKVVSTGLEYDRLYTFAQLKSPFPVSVQGAGRGEEGDDATAIAAAAREHKWESITQRQFPRLAALEVELWQPDLDKLKGLNDKNAQSNSEAFLILRFPWREPGFSGLWDLFAAKCLRGWAAVVEKEVLLPVEFPPAEDIAAKGYARETVRVGASEEKKKKDGGNGVAALDMSVELPKELRLYLGVSNKLGLFRANPATLGEVSDPRAPVEKKAGHLPVVGFHDSYPVHIVNVSSVKDLESKITKDEELQGLRPDRNGANMLVSGLPAHDENDWKTIAVRPDSSSQDSEIKFHGAPKKSGPGVRMTPLFDKIDLAEGYLEVDMSVDVLER